QANLISEAIARLYPTRRWGELDDAARYRQGVPQALGHKLARVGAEVLQARTWFREGAEDELCDYIYVLCVGREPALLDVRDGIAEPEADKIDESYLRVALSSVLRAGTVQEVQMHLRRRGDAFEFREQTRDGVYDPVLLKRLQKTVDLIRQADLTY